MAQSEFRFDAGAAGAAQAGAASAGSSAPPRRYALGLPAGSIRAILTFMVLGLVWALLYLQREVPTYLTYLMFMILGHYFASRHQSAVYSDPRESSPLYMPRGFIRALILLGFIGILVAIYFQNKDHVEDLVQDLKLQTDQAKKVYLPLLLVLGFFVGLIVAKMGDLIGGKDGQPGWYQDIQAWLALLAMLGLAAEVIVQLVINPRLEEDKKINVPELQNVLAAIVGFYFGARS